MLTMMMIILLLLLLLLLTIMMMMMMMMMVVVVVMVMIRITTTIMIIVIMIMMMMMMMIMMMMMMIIIALKGAIRDASQSPHCAANRLLHVRSSGQRAIVCRSHATHRALITCNISCATWYEGESHRVEIALIFALLNWVNH